jgi:hypothetical protein
METVFISELKPFLDAITENMELYVPKKSGEHYIFTKYKSVAENPVELNNIRACMPVKEFLFPVCELAATYPAATEPEKIKPFAVFGLKDCDLRSIKILDKVFAEKELQDPFYIARRENMFIISSDCSTPADSCFCNLFGGQGFSPDGFDLNISAVRDGFIIEAGSSKGKRFIEEHSGLFAEVSESLLAELQTNRSVTEEQLKQNNTDFELNGTIKQIVQNNQESEIFDAEAKNCVECQACTRVYEGLSHLSLFLPL